MIGHFQTLLAGVVANPGCRISELPLLGEEERQRVLVEWNDTGRRFQHPNRCAHELFEEQVIRTPDAIALVSEDVQLSYCELNRRTNQLAHHLRQFGVGPEVRVAISMRRSPNLIVAILGIMKAGGAYVPIDPSYPSERLSFMFEDAGVPLILTAGKLSKMCSHSSRRRLTSTRSGIDRHPARSQPCASDHERQPGLCDLHIRFDWSAKGCAVDSPRTLQFGRSTDAGFWRDTEQPRVSILDCKL